MRTSPTDDPAVLPGARTACIAAVAGITRRGTAGRRTASTTGPGSATASWASVSPWFCRTRRLSGRR